MEQSRTGAERAGAYLRANLLEVGVCLAMVLIAAVAPSLTRSAEGPEAFLGLTLGPIVVATALYLRIRVSAAARQSPMHQRARDLAVARGEQDAAVGDSAVVSGAVVTDELPAPPLRHWMFWLPPLLVMLVSIPHLLTPVLADAPGGAVVFFAIAAYVAMLVGVLCSVLVFLPLEGMARASMRLLRGNVQGHGLAISLTFVTLVAAIAFASRRAVDAAGGVLTTIPAYVGAPGEYYVISEPWLWATRVLLALFAALVLSAIRGSFVSGRYGAGAPTR